MGSESMIDVIEKIKYLLTELNKLFYAKND